MKVALVTMNVKQGRCEENFTFMREKIEEAIREKADMVVFPQNAVSGYLLGDRWLEDAWCHYVDSFNERLIALSEQIAIVWGNIKYRNARRFNAAFFAYQGKTHMRVKKNTSDYANDHRYFEQNTINSAIEFKDMVLALNFHDEVQLADININIDACPYDMDEAFNIHGNVIYANAVGMQNCAKNVMVMQGGSFVHHQQTYCYHAPYFVEEMAYIDLEHAVACEEEHKPVLLDALACGIRSFDEQVFGGKIPWIIGLSGGLDSSVNCALLSYALGADRVYGFNMATQHNRTKTIGYAASEARALGIHYREGSIEAFVSASNDVFKNVYGFGSDEGSGLVAENIQARSRGYLLSGFAGILGGVIVNNGNKVESMLGYCTLYGDSVGALSLIADLTKVQLFELSKTLNTYYGKEVIPEALLPIVQDSTMTWEMAPSAELKEEQFDPMKWFYHDYLCEHLGKDMDVCDIMRAYVDSSFEPAIMDWIRYYHLDEPKAFLEDLDWFLTTMNRNAFKRLQTPPIICLHKKTLAMQVDAQMKYDQTMYDALREKILAM